MTEQKYSKGPSQVGSKIKDLCSRRFTFLIIPHGAGNPRQINIYFSHIVIVLALWTLVTGWGSYLSAQHIDYWRTKVNNQVLTLKVNYLVSQLDQTTGFLDQVKGLEGQLKDMLQYKDESSLIQGTVKKQASATGGPTDHDQRDLASILRNAPKDISWNRLIEKTGIMKSEAQSRIQNYDDLTKYVETRKRMFLATPRGKPVEGHLTSHYGHRIDPFLQTDQFHSGVDIGGRIGTPIRATADGRVQIAGWHSGYGNLVILQHEFGYTTRYGHNSKLLVKYGQTVKRGQVIALLGQTGRASGPHCHYEVFRYGSRQNPFAYIKEQFPKFNAPKTAQSLKSKSVGQPS
jgi:murein DD-endopeptidase MepM/ murein hydrolase activator NlpD